MFNITKDYIEKDSNLNYDVSPDGGDFKKNIRVRITNCGQNDFIGTLRLTLALPEKMNLPWRMVPGFIYGENRRLNERSRLYPRVDAALAIPSCMSSSWWDFAADRTASPLVFAHQDGQAIALGGIPHFTASTGVTSDDPEPQIGIGFGNGYLRVSIPACEEPFTYSGTSDTEPTICRITLPPGECIEQNLFVYQLTGDRDCYRLVVEDYYRTLRQSQVPAEKPETALLLADAVSGILAHYHRDDNYFIYSRPYFPVIEQICNGRGTTAEWHQMNTGFVNGIPVCLALLKAAGSVEFSEARDVAIKVANRICAEGLSPSGLFRADFMPQYINSLNGRIKNPIYGEKRRGEWGSGWLSDPECVHSRTIGDACDSLAAMILLEEKKRQKNACLVLWKDALRRNLDAVLSMQLSEGSYGQYYNAENKTVVKKDGCGGLLWIPALIKSTRIFIDDTDFIKNARQSVIRAGRAYASYVNNDNIWGAPEDNESPTSEDGMNAIMAYCDLYELTEEKQFLDLAVTAANWMLTFRKTYNVRVPEKSIMGQYQMKSLGGDFASASNNHLHVFEALCSQHLKKLTTWTGNDYYAARADEHWRFVCQHLSSQNGMLGGFRGAMAEQFYWTNWGSFGSSWRKPEIYQQKGSASLFTAVWCIAVIALAAEDN
jgi:hypothetical protein